MRSKGETEKLANELMNIEIPNYKPSTNHVKLFEKGNVCVMFSNILITLECMEICVHIFFYASRSFI